MTHLRRRGVHSECTGDDGVFCRATIKVVATINRNGHPHLTPNWYRYDGKVLTLITRKDRLKYLNVQRNNHISVCIYDPPAASNYVVISGTATCNDQDIWDEARRIIERYRPADQVDDYVARWKTEPRAYHGDTGAHRDTGAQRTVNVCSARRDCVGAGRSPSPRRPQRERRDLRWDSQAHGRANVPSPRFTCRRWSRVGVPSLPGP